MSRIHVYLDTKSIVSINQVIERIGVESIVSVGPRTVTEVNNLKDPIILTNLHLLEMRSVDKITVSNREYQDKIMDIRSMDINDVILQNRGKESLFLIILPHITYPCVQKIIDADVPFVYMGYNEEDWFQVDETSDVPYDIQQKRNVYEFDAMYLSYILRDSHKVLKTQLYGQVDTNRTFSSICGWMIIPNRCYEQDAALT